MEDGAFRTPQAATERESAVGVGEDHVSGAHALITARDVLCGEDASHFAREPQCLVDVVDHLVHDDAAADGFVGEPGLHRHRTGALEAQNSKLAESASINSTAKRLVLREEPHNVRGEKNQASLASVFRHARRLARGERERLLAQHVRAVIERGVHVLGMRRGWGAHVNDVDRPEETLERVVDRDGRELGGEVFRSLTAEHVDVGTEGPPAAGVGTGNSSGSHDAHARVRLRVESHLSILSSDTEP